MSRDLFKMQKTVKLYSSPEEADADDREFYRSLSPNQRVELTMQLMEMWNGATFKRLERTCQLLDAA